MSSSSYYDAIKRIYTNTDADIINEIQIIRAENQDYGYRRVTLELRNLGLIVNHKRVLRIMTEQGLLCHAFERKTRKYNSYKGSVGKIAKNLLHRKFITDRPYQKIVTDVTELRWGNQTMDERAYFTSFTDLYNGEILSWNLDKHPTVSFVTQPLQQFVDSLPELNYRTTIHSDQGFQYQNCKYQKILRDNKIFQSMSRKATCLDNACAESIFHIIKVGTVHNNHYETYEVLEKNVKKYVHYYNNERIKVKLAGMSPVKYRIHTSQKAA